MEKALSQLRETADLVAGGVSSVEALTLGMQAMLGLRVPLVSDRIVLLRRQMYPAPGGYHYCGSADPEDGEIANEVTYGHEAEMGYQYAAVRMHANGYRSVACEPVRVDFDDEGELIVPALPAPPADLAATPIGGGKFLVTWRYSTFGQGACPADFQVFAGETTPDYETPLVDSETELAYVSYEPGRAGYGMRTAAYEEGTVRVFGVRGRNSNGVAELNVLTTSPRRAAAASPVDGTIRAAVQGSERRW